MGVCLVRFCELFPRGVSKGSVLGAFPKGNFESYFSGAFWRDPFGCISEGQSRGLFLRAVFEGRFLARIFKRLIKEHFQKVFWRSVVDDHFFQKYNER